ncbi:hypothetical protein [Flavobacterium lipolyticum]|uniref:Uncharacterized protein n=1 Tax=Flavobacterium lipolyticum TaxID=2893754 RepID=A0ABS8M4L8_9FLAO|nr:hypothetical protein [Flavobacterium sp. F-126]MCC9019764.1 hypothetical protein [Flavobacterium sp. F-126]
MEIIVLEGSSNTGKSTTIGLLYQLLLNVGTSTNKQPLGGDPKDFSDIVINYKNLKIAVFSMGDNSTAISQAIVHYNNQKCDLFICSLSTGTPKIRANNRINQFNNTRISKTIASQILTESQANNNDASRIFALI